MVPAPAPSSVLSSSSHDEMDPRTLILPYSLILGKVEGQNPAFQSWYPAYPDTLKKTLIRRVGSGFILNLRIRIQNSLSNLYAWIFFSIDLSQNSFLFLLTILMMKYWERKIIRVVILCDRIRNQAISSRIWNSYEMEENTK